MQLQVIIGDERVAWIKIIENILVVVDPRVIEQATRGEWQIGLVRCLETLMHDRDTGAGEHPNEPIQMIPSSNHHQISTFCISPRDVSLVWLPGKFLIVPISQRHLALASNDCN
jgi:hypothetical protein